MNNVEVMVYTFIFYLRYPVSFSLNFLNFFYYTFLFLFMILLICQLFLWAMTKPPSLFLKIIKIMSTVTRDVKMLLCAVATLHGVQYISCVVSFGECYRTDMSTF